MADHFVDSVNGNNANTGHTMDAAWATVEYAEESGALAAGDIVWVRRNVAELPTSDITSGYDGTVAGPIYVIGCPRTTVSITSSDWTNGNTAVTIDDGGMTLAAHGARMILAPDGNEYFITNVTSSTGIVLLKEYAGTTATNQAATIQADEDYTLFNTIDDSAWTIKKSNWNADAHTLPSIDFNDGAYQWIMNSSYNRVLKNMFLMDSSDASGVLYVGSNRNTLIKGCIIKQTASTSRVFYHNGGMNTKLSQTLIIGPGGTGTGITVDCAVTPINFENVAIYGSGGYGVSMPAGGLWDNVNIGIEQSNANYDVRLADYGVITARNLRLGGTNGLITNSLNISVKTRLNIENYQTFGEHRTFWAGGYWMRQLMPDSTDVAQKLTGYAIKIVPNVTGFVAPATLKEWHIPVFEANFIASTTSRTYRIWIYNRAMGTLNSSTAYDNIWMNVKYLKTYDDTSEYIIGSSDSTQTSIANAASSSDWDYLEVASVAPALADKVRITVYFNAYHATGMVYIDPQVVIS